MYEFLNSSCFPCTTKYIYKLIHSFCICLCELLDREMVINLLPFLCQQTARKQHNKTSHILCGCNITGRCKTLAMKLERTACLALMDLWLFTRVGRFCVSHSRTYLYENLEFSLNLR